MKRVALALAVPSASIAGGAASAWASAAMDVPSLDARYVAVACGALAPLLVGAVMRTSSKRRRTVLLVLALPWLGALVFPRSSIAVTWLSGSLLALGGESFVRAARVSWQLQLSKGARVGVILLIAGAGFYVLSAVGVVVVNMQLAVFAVRIAHQSPDVAADEVEVVIESVDGYAIEGTFSEGRAGSVGVVLVHGVSDGRDRWLPWVRRLREDGLHALRFDQRAHGRSDGAVCSYGQRERHDVGAAARWMRSRPGVDGVVVVGTSMGGGAVLAASATIDADSLIVLAPASDYAALVRERSSFLGPFAPPVLAGSAAVARAMGQVPMTDWSPRAGMTTGLPVLVFHGTRDSTIAIELSRSLAEQHSNVELVELPGVEHNETPDAVAAGAWDRVQGAIDACPRDRTGI